MYRNLNEPQKEEFEKIILSLGESLDITETQYNALVKSYGAVGKYLQDDPELSQYDPLVSPQGSLRLGTIIQPVNEGDDMDVDLVFRLKEKNPAWTQKTLKDKVGDRLSSSPRYKEMLDEEGRRCWTLLYRQDSENLKERYHMDVLPAVANKDYDEQMRTVLAEAFSTENMDKISIRITDKKHVSYDKQRDISEWLKSNPDGYAIWFANRCRDMVSKTQLLTEDIIPIGKYNPNKTPLQRIVQILKRHRDIMFNNDEDKPISIIITTLAAMAYKGEKDVLTGLVNVVEHLTVGITKDEKGNDKVANPLDPEENFADKWIEKPCKRANFYAWYDAVKRDIEAILSSRGPEIWRSMNKPFGRLIVESANKRYTESKKTSFKKDGAKIASTGVLGTIGQALNAGNTFYGEK